MGDEISLIYQATGRVVRAGNLPITAGVIVYNVETLWNVAQMLRTQSPVMMKWLTIGGNVQEPFVVKVPVGTPVEELFQKYGVVVPEEHSVIDGGPSMGKLIDVETAVVTKTTKGLLILPDNTPAMQSKFIDAKKSVARAETACCQCTRCTDLCPRYLLGYPLEPHKMVRTAMGAAVVMPQMVISATLCCGCGICETLACSQGISPRAVIAQYKDVLTKNKLRYQAKDDAEAREEREYRMIPSVRWAMSLGVEKIDKVAVFRGEEEGFTRVEIAMRSHIGAPSVPCVATGDTVKKGDKIAESGEGLSLPQYASMDGKVVVTGDTILIYKQ